MIKKTIEIPDGYMLVESKDENGETIYRVKKDDYTNIKTLDDVIKVLGEDDLMVKTHSLLVHSEGLAYSALVRLRAEMIVKAFRNGLEFTDFRPNEIYSPLFMVDTQSLCVTSNGFHSIGCPSRLCINSKAKCEYMIETFEPYFIEYFTC